MSFTIHPLRSLRAAHQPSLPSSFSISAQQTSQTFFIPTYSRTLGLRRTSLMPTASLPSSVAAQRSQAIARHFSTTSSQASSNMNLYSYSKTPSEYTPRTVGQPYTLDYRCYIEKNGQPVSPFHDIPLYANEQQTILNMVVEIPRWSNAKQEVSKTGLEVAFAG